MNFGRSDAVVLGYCAAGAAVELLCASVESVESVVDAADGVSW